MNTGSERVCNKVMAATRIVEQVLMKLPPDIESKVARELVELIVEAAVLSTNQSSDKDTGSSVSPHRRRHEFEFTDGSFIEISAVAGGGSPGGFLSTVNILHHKSDGTEEIINFVKV